jgi:hypothetical protein
MLSDVKVALAAKGFRALQSFLVNGEIILRDEARRAAVPYAQAIAIIESAADEAAVWAALEAVGVIRLRPRRPDNTPDPDEDLR